MLKKSDGIDAHLCNVLHCSELNWTWVTLNLGNVGFE